MWNVAKAEIEAYRACICRLLSKRSFDDIDPVKHILELFMGKMSSLMSLMMRELNLSYQKVAHFLGTFCVQKSYCMSVEDLYDDDDNHLKMSNLLK